MRAILTKNGVEVCGSDSLVHLDGRRKDHARQCRAHALSLAHLKGPRWADGAVLFKGPRLDQPCGKVSFGIVHAWTGGDAPAPEWWHPLVDALLQEQVREWVGHWRVPLPDDVRETFVCHARHDAWASLREDAR